MARREELTRFLKTARGRIAPGEVGLPAGERRRAAGLRREEVASLSGMSVTWYTWFEQGRDVKLSAAMLERLSAALRLPREEREYLFALAQHRPPPLTLADDEEVHPAIQRLLDALAIPAQVMTQDWTVIGWNRLVTRLFRDYAALPREGRNLFKILLLDPRYRTDGEAHQAMVRQIVGRFKWDYSRAADPQRFDALIAELLAQSDDFRAAWHDSAVTAHLWDRHTTHVPGIGTIALEHTSYVVEEAPGQRLLLFVPMDAASAARLRQVAD